MQHPGFVVLCLVAALTACSSRRVEPVAPPAAPAAPPVTPPPAAAPAPDPAAGALTTPPAAPEPELPPAVQACNRKCSAAANHRQMEGFVRCERAKKGPDCKTAVLTANDSERSACRKACETKTAP